MVRQYTKVNDEMRKQLISFIREGKPIKEAAREINIKYENAKAIVRIYRNELRTDKRKSRFRYKMGEDKSVIKRNKLTF